jgi:hypothetical protein
LHELLAQVLGATSVGEPVKALDPEQARAVCALLLSGLFLGRTVKNFGLWKPFPQKIGSYPFFLFFGHMLIFYAHTLQSPRLRLNDDTSHELYGYPRYIIFTSDSQPPHATNHAYIHDPIYLAFIIIAIYVI